MNVPYGLHYKMEWFRRKIRENTERINGLQDENEILALQIDQKELELEHLKSRRETNQQMMMKLREMIKRYQEKMMQNHRTRNKQ